MDKHKNSKILAAFALIVGVAGLSFGFASYTNTLTIRSSAEVKPDGSKFNVDFSSSSTAVETDEIVPTLNKTVEGFTATKGVIDNSSEPTLKNIKVIFTEPGQSATYSFNAYNAGEYDAFLKSIVFKNVSGESSAKVCTAGSETTQALVDSACNDISISIKVGDEAAVTGSKAPITGHTLVKTDSEPVVVTISYAENGHLADGEFTIDFGDITLLYSSVD